MKKQSHKKLQLQTTTVRLLQTRLDDVAGGFTSTQQYSQAVGCSHTCTCSTPCTVTERPCIP